ncbi:MAG TPA: tetratricopeptide repeat protein [Coxiellaceae bacterium]|nr:MAG: hypothetical protein A3E81_08455 [Gammaproteobacteria bacterium RIFCSPHIGHO2_12_FULL_36_30]HLB55752.1 tetratricopeptide repeat protein [Coxiellaceae bacterium]
MNYYRKIIPIILFSFISLTCFAETYNSAAAHTNAQLGMAYLNKGMYPASKHSLLLAIKEDPQLASVWYCMAYYLEKTGHPTQAEKYYREAIKVKPHSGSAKNNYGTFLCRVGREKQGIKELIAASKEHTYLNAASALENAGTCALMMHNKTLAMHYYHQALANNPSMPFSILSLARLNYQMGNDAEAKRYYTYFEKLELTNKPTNVVKAYHDYVFGKKTVNG